MTSALVVAIVTSIASAVVSITSVVVNAVITRLNSKTESARAKEARDAEDARAAASREAEDRRLREDRDAEARRRDVEATAAATHAAQALLDARIQQRWATVREALDAEAKVRASDATTIVYEYRKQIQSLSLLTHPDESNLRRALLARARTAEQGWQAIGSQIHPEWWHPWISEWARNVDAPLITTTADTGPVF